MTETPAKPNHTAIIGKILNNQHIDVEIRKYFPHPVEVKGADFIWIALYIGPPYCDLKFSKISGSWYATKASSTSRAKNLQCSEAGLWTQLSNKVYFVDPRDAIRFKLARA